MHSILDLKPDRPVLQDNETLKERLSEASPRGFLVHDNGAQLLVITDEDYLSAPKHQGYHTLYNTLVRQRVSRRMVTRTWFCGLSSFVDENCPELQFRQPGISRADTGATDDVGSTKNLSFALLNQSLIFPLVVGAQLSPLVLQ